jgi:hypothetical protein
MNKNSISFKRNNKPVDPHLHNLASFFTNNQQFAYSNNNFLTQKTRSIHISNKDSSSNQTANSQINVQEYNEKLAMSRRTKSIIEGSQKKKEVIQILLVASSAFSYSF